MTREQFEITKRNLRDSIDYQSVKCSKEVAKAQSYLEGYRAAMWDAFNEFENFIVKSEVDND